MTAFQVFSRQNEETLAMVRAVAAVQQSVDTTDRLPAVFVVDRWYGFAGLGERGRMAFVRTEVEGWSFMRRVVTIQTFCWRPLIGGSRLVTERDDWPFDDEFGLCMDPCEHPSINGDECAACGETVTGARS